MHTHAFEASILDQTPISPLRDFEPLPQTLCLG